MSAGADNSAEDKGADEAPETEERRGCLSVLMPSSTPGCASFLAVVFLLSTVITVWVVFWMDPDNIPWRHAFSWWRIAAILLLVAAIPLGVYKTVSLWLDGPPNAFPEMDHAWRAGVHALAANELSLDSVPIFLITGSSCEAQERAIMNATGMRFSVEGVPHGPAPFHWYANSEAIYLFCSDTSWTSALASLREEIAMEAAAVGVSPEPNVMTRGAFENAMAAASIPSNFSEPEPPAAPSAGGADYRGTIVWNDTAPTPAPRPTASPSAAAPGPGSGRPPSFSGTLILGDNSGTFDPPDNPSDTIVPALPPTPVAPRQSQSAPARPFSTGSDTNGNRKPVLLSHQYATSCLKELQHLGDLLRRARRPLCPINGMLALIQFEAIHASPPELEELQKALSADIETIQYAFGLRCPVSALIVGLEKERGFRELVLRVGKDRAFSQRFGRRFDIHAIPSKDQMAALATHVCGVFEDWSYSLFREENSLTRPGNTRLYELLSKVRCEWKTRLSDILSGGFGCESGKSEEKNSLLFSGCYFAATGDTPDRQAFVKGVVDKLNEEQELIEWTPDALRANYLQSIAAGVGMVVTLILMLCLAIMMFVFG